MMMVQVYYCVGVKGVGGRVDGATIRQRKAIEREWSQLGQGGEGIFLTK